MALQASRLMTLPSPYKLPADIQRLLNDSEDESEENFDIPDFVVRTTRKDLASTSISSSSKTSSSGSSPANITNGSTPSSLNIRATAPSSAGSLQFQSRARSSSSSSPIDPRNIATPPSKTPSPQLTSARPRSSTLSTETNPNGTGLSRSESLNAATSTAISEKDKRAFKRVASAPWKNSGGVMDSQRDSDFDGEGLGSSTGSARVGTPLEDILEPETPHPLTSLRGRRPTAPTSSRPAVETRSSDSSTYVTPGDRAHRAYPSSVSLGSGFAGRYIGQRTSPDEPSIYDGSASQNQLPSSRSASASGIMAMGAKTDERPKRNWGLPQRIKLTVKEKQDMERQWEENAQRERQKNLRARAQDAREMAARMERIALNEDVPESEPDDDQPVITQADTEPESGDDAEGDGLEDEVLRRYEESMRRDLEEEEAERMETQALTMDGPRGTSGDTQREYTHTQTVQGKKRKADEDIDSPPVPDVPAPAAVQPNGPTFTSRSNPLLSVPSVNGTKKSSLLPNAGPVPMPSSSHSLAPASSASLSTSMGRSTIRRERAPSSTAMPPSAAIHRPVPTAALDTSSSRHKRNPTAPSPPTTSSQTVGPVAGKENRSGQTWAPGSGHPNRQGSEGSISERPQPPPIAEEVQGGSAWEKLERLKEISNANGTSAASREREVKEKAQREKMTFDREKIAPIPVAAVAERSAPPPPSDHASKARAAAQAQAQAHAHAQAQAQAQAEAQLEVPGKKPHYIWVNRKSYHRLDCIGRGGSSRVYRVLSQDNEIFAIKKVSLDRADEETVSGYVNEISLLARLSGNDRIIRLFQSESSAKKKTLTMVLECGEIDMARLLQEKQGQPILPHWIATYWQQMLEAVQVIHEEKIVHSDLKPANFVLVKGSLKLIDFGIAKAIPNDTTNIQRDQQIGTVNYMSPEAIEDSNMFPGKRIMKLGRPSDVWSLGCILYQMIYGQPPFYSLSVFQKMKAIPDPNHQIDYPSISVPTIPGPKDASGAGGPPQERREQFATPVPEDVRRLIQSCLQRDPKKRSLIPDLLASPWLNDWKVTPPQSVTPPAPQKKPFLRSDEAVLSATHMEQLISYVMEYTMENGPPNEDIVRQLREEMLPALQRSSRQL